MNDSRRIGVAHRGHGSPSCPYAFRDREKYPDCPLTLTYSESKLVPPLASASFMTS